MLNCWQEKRMLEQRLMFSTPFDMDGFHEIDRHDVRHKRFEKSAISLSLQVYIMRSIVYIKPMSCNLIMKINGGRDKCMTDSRIIRQEFSIFNIACTECLRSFT